MFNDLWNQLLALVGTNILNLLSAIGILIIGWIIARLIAWGVYKLLQRTNLDNRLAGTITADEESADETPKLNVERWVSTGVFYLLMLFVLIAFFQTLQLTAVSGPLSALLDQLLAALPQLIGALLILLVAWVIATVVKMLISRVLRMSKFDERVSDQADVEADKVSISDSLANGIFWLVFLLFLPAVLNALGMQGLVQPVQGVVDQFLGAIPNIFAAGIIFVVGWFIARIVRQIVTNLLAATRLDSFGEQVGLGATEQPLSKIIGSIVYVLVLIPAVIAALNTLQIEALSTPAVTMLTTVLNAIPAFFGAVIVLAVAYFAGRLVAGLVSNLLAGVGFNKLPELLGFQIERQEGQRTLSEIVGVLVVVTVMLLAAIEAADILGLGILASMIANFTTFGGQVLLAVVIFGIGLYLANLARNVIVSAGGESSAFTANLARIAILIFAVALALQQLGIASEIVNLAFGILLGTIGVAAALAFGLGSREIAGKQTEEWVNKMKK
ncbi:MAG: mechanosensitive ion channel [Anaerolineales bacterium]